MIFKRKAKPVRVVVKTDSFSDIKYVQEQTRNLCDEMKKINPDVRLNIEVDLRRG